ncbi:MAG: hypothetical protein RIT25_2469, partial [Planctomycetota bacterium]
TQPQPATTPAVEPGQAPATEYSLKAPEGSQLSEQLLQAIASQAKTLGVEQEAAQKMLAVLATVQPGQQQHQSIVQQWQTQAAADPRVGGANAEATTARVDAALERAGTPALRELLNATGLIHQPDLRHLLAQAGVALSPDGGPVRGAPARQSGDRYHGMLTHQAGAQRMPYHSMQRNNK